MVMFLIKQLIINILSKIQRTYVDFGVKTNSDVLFVFRVFNNIRDSYNIQKKSR